MGVYVFSLVTDYVKLSGANSVIGKAMVITLGVDDLGLGGTPQSLIDGNSGSPIFCGIIQAA